MTADFFPFPKSLTQRSRNLPDMRNLFHRRTNECRQAFPFRLTNDSEAATKIARCVHERVGRKRGANLIQRMIEREIMRNRGMYILRISPRTLAGSRCHFRAQDTPSLFYVSGAILYRPAKTGASSFPMKDLARIQCHREIEMRRGNLSLFHG